MKNKFNTIVLLARLLIGGILIYASIDKILYPGDFAKAINNYHIIPFGLENIFSIILPWLELIIGAFLILGILLDGASLLVILMMLIFISAITFAMIMGYNIECGCGLKPGEMIGFQKIIEDITYLIIALLILKRPEHQFELYPKI